MADKKVIAILGATGAQGGGLANAILDDPSSEFSVRALTRNTNSDKAKALAEKGAEVVAVDIDNNDDLLKAFAGSTFHRKRKWLKLNQSQKQPKQKKYHMWFGQLSKIHVDLFLSKMTACLH